MGMGKKILLFIVMVVLAGGVFGLPKGSLTYAQEDVYHSSGLKIPRYVSLKKNKVFVRTGPALRYPIKWVYKRKGLPVEIIQEFDTWRKVKDIDGEEGWIHQSLISGRRMAIITQEGGTFLYKKPDDTTKKLAKLEAQSIARLENCMPNWCEVEIQGFSGFLQRKSIWGVYEDEKFD